LRRGEELLAALSARIRCAGVSPVGTGAFVEVTTAGVWLSRSLQLGSGLGLVPRTGSLTTSALGVIPCPLTLD